MGGALLDLVAKGGQDIYFICNPQISFFKKVFKRHTNFSTDYEKFYLNGEPDFGKSSKLNIPRKGDLIKNIYLQRIKEYKQNPPALDWDGSYTATSK